MWLSIAALLLARAAQRRKDFKLKDQEIEEKTPRRE